MYFLGSTDEHNYTIQQSSVISSFHRCTIGDKLIEYRVACLIFAFQTIHDRPSFDCQFTFIVYYLIIGLNASHIHWEVYFYHIACFPAVEQCSITICNVHFCFLSIDCNCVLRSFIRKRIQVGRNRSILCPSGNTEMHGKLMFVGRSYFNSYFSIPRITGGLFQFYLIVVCFYIGFALYIEVHINIIRLSGVHIMRNGSHKAGNVSRTAGTAKPALTPVLPHRFQWIIVEKFITTE